jgi:hypothetical protein
MLSSCGILRGDEAMQVNNASSQANLTTPSSVSIPQNPVQNNQTPVDALVAQAASGSPLAQGEALRTLDQMTGDRAATDLVARGGPSTKGQGAEGENNHETCTVEVRYRGIGATANLANHAFITTTDSDSTNFFRGGPSGVGIGGGSSGSGASSAGSNTSGGDQAERGWGTIVTSRGAYVPGTPDWTTSPSAQHTVQTTHGNCDAIERNFAQTTDAIEASNTPYSPFGPNSNSTVREILERNGIQGVRPAVTAPGWETTIPLR